MYAYIVSEVDAAHNIPFGRESRNAGFSPCRPIIKTEMDRIGEIYNDVVVVDKYVMMPNHIHMIILLRRDDGRPKVAPTISRMMQQFKGAVTKQIGVPLWQKLHHDHIIRNEQEYQKIWQYIDTNSFKWEEDCFYKKD